MLKIFDTGKLLVKNNMFVVKKQLLTTETTRVTNSDLTYTIVVKDIYTQDYTATTYAQDDQLVQVTTVVHDNGNITETTTDRDGFLTQNKYVVTV